MPNGHNDTYNKDWCDERHNKQDQVLADLNKSVGAIQVDIATIKNTAVLNAKWIRILFLLGGILCGGGGVLAAKAGGSAPTQEVVKEILTQIVQDSTNQSAP